LRLSLRKNMISNKTPTIMSNNSMIIIMISTKSLAALLTMTQKNLIPEMSLSIMMLLSFDPTERSHRPSLVSSIVYYSTRVVRKHKGSAFLLTCAEAISDAAWHAMMSFNRTRRDKLKGSIYSLFPQRKNTFKVFGVKNVVPKTMMIHSQNLNVQLSSRLHTSQKEIHFLCNQLRDFEKTMRS
jgi:hypothetical protein